MDLILKVWRQKDSKAKGKIETYPISNISRKSERSNDIVRSGLKRDYRVV